MSTTQSVEDPASLNFVSIVRLRCPRCSHGKLFRGWFSMNPECEKCGLRFEREQGYYLGSIYFNYGATALLSATAYTILAFVFDLPAELVLAACVGFTVVFPLWFFRYSRSVFLAIDYYINPEYEREALPASSPEEPQVLAIAPIEETTKQVSAESDHLQSPISNAVTTALPFTDQELASLSRDDAAAGTVVALVVTLALLFGLTLVSIVVFADFAFAH